MRVDMHMGWPRLVRSWKLQVSFAKETYKRDDILQKRPMILRSLLIVAAPYEHGWLVSLDVSVSCVCVMCVSCVCTHIHTTHTPTETTHWYPYACMGWLRLVGSLKLQVSFVKEPYKRDLYSSKRPIILRRLLIVATPYHMAHTKTDTTHWYPYVCVTWHAPTNTTHWYPYACITCVMALVCAVMRETWLIEMETCLVEVDEALAVLHICMWDMTHMHIRQDSFVYATWLMCMWDMTYMNIHLWDTTLLYVIHLYICISIHLHVSRSISTSLSAYISILKGVYRCIYRYRYRYIHVHMALAHGRHTHDIWGGYY